MYSKLCGDLNEKEIKKGGVIIGKAPDAGEDQVQKKRVSEDKMAGQHHQCNERELGQTPRGGEGQGGLICCNPCGCKPLLQSMGLQRVGHNWVTEQQHICKHKVDSLCRTAEKTQNCKANIFQ